MSDLSELLDRNRRFAETFEHGELPIRARFRPIILTCLDSRVDPTHFFDLQVGDAFVLRSAGGRANPGVVADLAALGQLAVELAGADAPAQELVIIQHTDCGMGRFAEPGAARALADRLGVDLSHVTERLAMTDPAQSVRDDIALLRETPALADDLVVSGFVYDVAHGTVEQVVAPSPLRAD